MRVVPDTNTIVSGLLWHGSPRQVLDAARNAKISLFTTAILLAELEEVLGRAKFTKQLAEAKVTAHSLVLDYAELATLVQPADIPPTIHNDPDDDEVLSCAVAAQAKIIVSGDSHLLKLKQFRDIEIMTAAELLEKIPKDE
ncbi:MAG: putative toxin-antitoxin system toxin component, PIN family [Chloroflexi bacterium]|nr:putative toxin-antitoxin system toxin component, PIN family [Chloroflexota bacterium]